MKLLIDMNLSLRWVTFLAESGIEAAHWSTCGSPHASDREILSYAELHCFVVLTHDLDFGAMLASTQRGKPSVVQIRATDVSPEAIGAPVLASLAQMAEELGKGALLTIDPGRARLKLLPLAAWL